MKINEIRKESEREVRESEREEWKEKEKIKNK